MARIIGTLLLLAGSSGMAYLYCNEQKQRLAVLRSMKEIFVRIKKEIEYLKAAIPEICQKLSTQEIAFKEVFKNIHRELELNNGCSFKEIWQRHFDEGLKKIPLKEAEKEMIKSFPESLIYRDSEGQADGTEKYIDEITKYVDDLNAAIKSKNKVVMCMGVMAGMITVVILF